MEIDHKQLLNQEDYLAKEKVRILNLNLIISILSILFMIAEIICSFLLNSLYSLSIPLLLGLLCIIGLLNAVFVLIWSLWTRSALAKTNDKWGDNTDTLLSRILFITSIFIFFGLLALTLILNIWGSRGLDLYLASSVDSSSSDYLGEWLHLTWITSAFSLLNMIVLLYMIYASFVCSGSPNTVRILLYESCILQMVFSFVVLNYVKLIFEYDEDSKISQFLNLNIYGILIFFLLVVIILSLTLYMINYYRWRSGYLMGGAMKIILILILIGIGGNIYRESVSIHEAFNGDCREYLSYLSYDDISTYGCTPKYIEYGLEYLNCTDSEQVLVWEDMINGESNTYKNTIGCLNKNCCNIVGDIYELNLLKLESFNIALVCAAFISVACCFFLTNKYSGERNLKKIMEYLFMVVLAILFILGVASLFFFEADIPIERTILSVDSSDFRKSLPKSNYSSSTVFLISSSCSLIKNYNPSFNITNTFSGDSFIRTIIVVNDAKLYYDNSLIFDEIQMFDKDLFSTLFDGLDITNKDILILQGNASDVQEFVNKDIYLCPNSLLGAIYLEYFTVSVNVTTNTANNSTLVWNYDANVYLQQIQTISHKSQNLYNETEYLDTTTNLTDLQNKLNALKFGDLTIKIYSMDSLTYQSQIPIKIIPGKQSVCEETTTQSILELSSDENGEITIYNLPYADYTVIAGDSTTHSNCLQVTIDQTNQTKIITLLNKLQSNQIAVMLEWGSTVDLNLFGSIEMNQTYGCVAGYFNEECLGLYFAKSQDTENQVQLVKITTLGDYDYLFFLKRELSWSEYQERLANSSELNGDFLTTTFSIKAFVSELQFPASEITYAGTNQNSSLVNETHIAYLAYCVDGEESDILNSQKTFWTGNSTFPIPSDVC